MYAFLARRAHVKRAPSTFVHVPVVVVTDQTLFIVDDTTRAVIHNKVRLLQFTRSRRR